MNDASVPAVCCQGLKVSGGLKKRFLDPAHERWSRLLLRAWADTSVQDMTELHRVSGEKRAAAAASKSAGVECQPNAAAPLLRDERARREWVEHELDMCCQVSSPKPPTPRAAVWARKPLLAVLNQCIAKSGTRTAGSCTCCCWL